MEEIRLIREGQKDLLFKGKQLACVEDGKNNDPNQIRYTKFALYKTEGGKYILHHKFVTRYHGEKNIDATNIFDAAQVLVESAKNDQDGYPQLFIELIKKAATNDPVFEGMMEERID